MTLHINSRSWLWDIEYKKYARKILLAIYIYNLPTLHLFFASRQYFLRMLNFTNFLRLLIFLPTKFRQSRSEPRLLSKCYV